ncbi:MAG TPA: DUF962 domain-containing protein [Pontibacter sp.]
MRKLIRETKRSYGRNFGTQTLYFAKGVLSLLPFGAPAYYNACAAFYRYRATLAGGYSSYSVGQVQLAVGSAGNWVWLCLGGHFFFERNKPATFKYPFYSLASDFKLFFDILLGKQGFRSRRP